MRAAALLYSDGVRGIEACRSSLGRSEPFLSEAFRSVVIAASSPAATGRAAGGTGEGRAGFRFCRAGRGCSSIGVTVENGQEEQQANGD